MFDDFVDAKTAKTGVWTTKMVIFAVVLHVAAGVALVVHGWWSISEIDRPTRSLATLSSMPPPPPPAGSGNHKKIEKREIVKVTKVKEVTQIDKRKVKPKVDVDTSESSDVGEEGGVEGGVKGGVIGGQVGGVIGGTGDDLFGDPAPLPQEKPKTLTPKALKALRISGDDQIHPPNNVVIEIRRSGKSLVASMFKICINTAGSVKSVSVLRSSGFPTYDSRIKSKMNNWKYKPLIVGGVAQPACSTIAFNYTTR